jgi:hypothetical protein
VIGYLDSCEEELRLPKGSTAIKLERVPSGGSNGRCGGRVQRTVTG